MDLPFAVSPNDVLAQPTRASLFSMLGELKRPAGTAELAERLALHPNGVRIHLERMETGGWSRARGPVKRATAPRRVDAPRRTPRPGGHPPSAYADLGRWLARAIEPTKNRLRDMESAGRRIGRELAPQDASARAEQRMHDALVALGFQPKRETAAAGTLSYRLCNCPYREAARESPQVICTLHRGMTRGLLDAIDPHTTLTGFVAEDPYEAGCLILSMRRSAALASLTRSPRGARARPEAAPRHARHRDHITGELSRLLAGARTEPLSPGGGDPVPRIRGSQRPPSRSHRPRSMRSRRDPPLRPSSRRCETADARRCSGADARCAAGARPPARRLRLSRGAPGVPAHRAGLRRACGARASPVAEHLQRSDSPVASRVLAHWEGLLGRGAFVKVMPHDYKRVLRELAEQEALVAARAAENGGPTVFRPVGRPLDAAGATQPEEEPA